MTSPLSVQKHGTVAAIALNNPPVNALSHAVRKALAAALGSLFVDAEVRAIVIGCEGRTFIAGADIREFGKPPLSPDVPELIELIDAAPKPLIAAMHGTVLGGGLELALACHYRLCTASTRLGLPEVSLGLLPGAGGTQRLPRLIGAAAALELIVDGALIPAARARSLGLVDDVVEGDLTAFALSFAERVVSEARPLPRVSQRSAVAEASLFDDYRRHVAEKYRGFLAPLRCIDAVQAAVELPFGRGLERERELFAELMASSQSKAQRHAFFCEREVAKVPDLPDDSPVRAVRAVAVVGVSALATRIARCLTEARLHVTELAMPVADSPSVPLRDIDLLIEAVPDTLEAKREVLPKLIAAVKPGAIVATSSAWLAVDAIAGGLTQQGDVVGMHFADTVGDARLVEVVRGPDTAVDAYLAVVKLSKTLGKVGVLLRAPLAARLLARVWREAKLLQMEGASLEILDKALYEFGFARGWLGEPELNATSLSGEPSLPARPAKARASALHGDEIVERCVFALVNESARALEAGVASRPLDIDMICLHGLGFPRFRGGALFYADQLGLRAVHAGMQKYQQQSGDESWAPARRITELVERGQGFYSSP